MTRLQAQKKFKKSGEIPVGALLPQLLRYSPLTQLDASIGVSNKAT